MAPATQPSSPDTMVLNSTQFMLWPENLYWLNEDLDDTLFNPVRVEIPGTISPKTDRLVVAFEGNVGAGKSSVLKSLKDFQFCPPWLCVQEPVESFYPFLDAFYEAQTNFRKVAEVCQHPRATIADLIRYKRASNHLHTASTLLQTSVLSSYVSLSGAPADNLLIERGPWSCLRVFTELAEVPNAYKSHIYDYARQQSKELSKLMPNVIIYLDTSPEICWHRIQLRGRGCELGIKLEQLRSLQRMYDAALREFPGKVIRISTQNKTPSKIAKEVATELQLLIDTQYMETATSYTMYLPKFSIVLQQHTSMVHEPILLPDLIKDEEDLIHIYTMDEDSNDSESPSDEMDQDELLDTVIPVQPYVHFYDKIGYVLVLYNRRVAGKFEFSKDFHDCYVESFGDYTKDKQKLRIDAHESLHVLSNMGFKAESGKSTNIAVALVPRRVQSAIKIITTPEGYEKVVIDSEAFATAKVMSMTVEERADDITLQRWFEGYECVAKCESDLIFFLHSDGSKPKHHLCIFCLI